MHVQQMHPGAQIVLIEKDAGLAEQQSGRNSGVLHTGIYYEPGFASKRNFALRDTAR